MTNVDNLDIQYKEITGKRSLIYSIFMVMFWGWNAIMLIVIVQTTNPPMSGYGSSLEQSTSSIGTTIGLMFWLIVWAAGSVIFGISALMTQPAKALVPITKDAKLDALSS
ncbi:MAG: hypothetical protein J4F49_06080 [Rhodobacteraceae bacterium]|nr:hypothetical protein [Paracoccaceae bacterium]